MRNLTYTADAVVVRLRTPKCTVAGIG